MGRHLLALLALVAAAALARWLVLPESRDSAPPSHVAEPAAAAPIVLRGRATSVTAGQASGTNDAPAGEPRPLHGVVTLHVLVLDAADDAPLEGAGILVRDEERLDLLPNTHEAVTDADGRAQVVLRAGRWIVGVRHRGHLRSGRRLRLGAAPSSHVRFRLDAAAGVAGRVLAPDGLPVAGALVEACTGGALGGSAYLDDRPPTTDRTESDGEGRFHVYVAQHTLTTISASAEGLGDAAVVVRGDAPGPPVTIRLAPEGVVRGFVQRDDETPVAGAQVWVVPEDGPFLRTPWAVRAGEIVSGEERDARDMSDWFAFAEVDTSRDGPVEQARRLVTDEEGRFECRRIALPATVRVLAEHGPWWRGGSAALPLDGAHASATTSVVLRPRGTLIVRVARVDGTPPEGASEVALPGAREHFLDPRGAEEDPWRKEVQAEGPARFEGLLPGPQQVEVDVETSGIRREIVDVVAGEETVLTVRGAAGLDVASQVVEPSGAGVPGLQVTFSPRRGAPRETRTDGEGRFLLRGLGPEGGTLHVRGAPWFTSHQRWDVVPGSAPRRIVIERRPVLRAVLVLPEEGFRFRGTATVTERIRGHRQHGAVVPVGADGSLRYPAGMGGSPRTIEIADVADPPLPPLILEAVRVPASGEVDLGRLALEVGVALEGRVEDPQGRPVQGAEVRWQVTGLDDAWDRARPSLLTDPAGGFRIEGVPRAPLLVVASHVGMVPVESTVTPPASGVILKLGRPGRIRGVALDAAGGPLTRGTVAFEAGAGATHAGLDAEGRFESPPLGAGAYEIWWIPPSQYDDDAVPLTTLQLGEGEHRDVRLELPVAPR